MIDILITIGSWIFFIVLLIAFLLAVYQALKRGLDD